MRDHDSIAIHERLLLLRQVPGFADADLSELASIAENLVETSFEAGEIVSAPPVRLSAIHMIIDGAFASGAMQWGPRRLFGAFEVIAGRGVPRPVVALTPTRTLRLAASDFAEVLEDNYTILSSARRGLAGRLLALSRAGRHSTSSAAAAHSAEARLGLVERLIALRQQMPFASARIQALAAIAQSSDEVHIAKGAVVHEQGTYADSMLFVVDGVLRSMGPDARVHGPGDAIGILEALAETAHRSSLDALTAVRALRVPTIALLDVMEDHTDFALGMITKLASELLDLVGTAGADAPGVREDIN